MTTPPTIVSFCDPGSDVPEPFRDAQWIHVDALDHLEETLENTPGAVVAVRPGPDLKRVLDFLSLRKIASALLVLPAGETQAPEAPLEKSEGRSDQTCLLGKLMDSIPSPVFFKDAQGLYLGCNEAFARFIGMAREEIPGKTVYDVSPPELAETYARADRDLLARRRPQVYEAWARNAEGELRSILFSKAVFYDSEGNPAGIAGVMTDLTEARSERETRENLARTKEHSAKMEALGTLAGGIAHDFNNLLAPILGYAEMTLEDVPADSEAHINVSEIIASALRAKGLIRQILSFSRQELEVRVPVRITGMVEEAVALVRSGMPADIKLVSIVEKDAGTVNADAVLVKQAIVNVATNAWEAMAEKGGTLTIRLTKVKEASCFPPDQQSPQGYARVSVSDTGPGIAPGIARKIFDPYFSTKEPGRGTGLGLAVVHGVMQHHGGCIAVEEQDGPGACLALYFPLLSHQEEIALSPKAEPSLTEDVFRLRILLVDDDLPLSDSMARMLTRLGYSVTVKTDPLEALALFSRLPQAFDLAVIDYSMPRMAGDRLAAFLMESRPGFPVILTTGYSDRITPESAKALGVCEFLYKPLTRDELIAAIRRAHPSPKSEV
ncbi:MAG: ATP-binding protein [Thermodesulfobacteriota bacterium]